MFTKRHVLSVILAALLLIPAATALAEEDPIAGIRHATLRMQRVAWAEAHGYGQFLDCMSSPNAGAMGQHYVNGDLLNDGAIDVLHPEALLFEPLGGGRSRLVGVEYLVFVDDWDAAHVQRPVLLGQVFNYVDDPSLGVPPFYALHVWAWKTNPDGIFADWNPNVTCTPPAVSAPPANIDLCNYRATDGRRVRPC